jgi:hypothetical protein
MTVSIQSNIVNVQASVALRRKEEKTKWWGVSFSREVEKRIRSSEEKRGICPPFGGSMIVGQIPPRERGPNVRVTFIYPQGATAGGVPGMEVTAYPS